MPGGPQHPLDSVFTHATARAAGLSMRQLQSRRWRRIFRGVYAPAEVPDSFELRIIAAQHVLPPRAVFAGSTAAYLWGAPSARREGDPVEALVNAEGRPRSRPGLRVRCAALPETDVMQLGPALVTSPLRTAYDLARRDDQTAAVIGVDAMLNRRICTLQDLRAFAEAHTGSHRSRAARAVLALVDAGAESPMETRLRLVIVHGGLPRPTTQWEIYDERGRFLGRVDLAYPHRRLAIEYDGVQHADVTAWRNDLTRQRGIEQHGWRFLRYTATEVFGQPDLIVQQVRRALG